MDAQARYTHCGRGRTPANRALPIRLAQRAATADPAGLTARARPETRAANLSMLTSSRSEMYLVFRGLVMAMREGSHP
jgi:hypothetical protein